MNNDTIKFIKDLSLRFFLGGSAVAGCYLLLLIIPWKSVAGIFAAFPAVMIAAVIMSGCFEGNDHAAQTAFGATAGMLGCTVCVITAERTMHYLQNWPLALIFSLIAWFISSAFFITLMNRYLSNE
ncbi:MAG TPA: DUF3147 family protein [Syntrophomonadaceae bacterium]|jgi:hypothetical protein|nr:DUF3147 family protein [Syntrophomonadaceae bacterium]